MVKRLMNTHYRDHYIYIFLFSIFIYIGIYFNALETNFSVKIVGHIVLTANAFLVYYLLSEYFCQSVEGLIASLMYLASPIHLDAFIYIHQFPFLISEFLIFLCLIMYLKRKNVLSFLFLTLAILVNNHFVFLLPLCYFAGKKDERFKVTIWAFFVVSLLYTVLPEFRLPTVANFSSMIFWIENILSPSSPSLLDRGLVTSQPHLDLILFLAVFIVMVGYLWMQKEFRLFMVAVFLVLTSVILIPHKYITSDEFNFIYLKSSNYVSVLFVIILFLRLENLLVNCLSWIPRHFHD